MPLVSKYALISIAVLNAGKNDEQAEQHEAEKAAMTGCELRF
ncbi:hypothetical protein [Paenibacillus phytorum]|nr:hypothetical protein [Paenibacillus phytorum]